MLKTTELEITLPNQSKKIPLLELDEVDSTNDYLKRIAQEKEELIVRANYQTHGRGQFDRRWESPKEKNLLFSILLKPSVLPNKTTLLTTLAADAIIQSLSKQTGLTFTVKKPNDVYCSGKKIAGILTEQESVGNKVQYVIVGMGININAAEGELLPEATSLFVETNQIFDSRTLLTKIVEAFYQKATEAGIL